MNEQSAGSFTVTRLVARATLATSIGAVVLAGVMVARRAPASPAGAPSAVVPSAPTQGPPPFGPGAGPPPFAIQDRAIAAQFDADKSGWLDQGERQKARRFLEEESARGGPNRRWPGPPDRRRESPAPAAPGPKLTPADVAPVASNELYDPAVMRTLFLEFESADWEAELAAFHSTDVEVPATLIVDGKRYPQVGVHFRGMSSFMMVASGYKRSLNVTLDLVDTKQRLYGYRTLNLLNSHEDPSFLRTVLALDLTRRHMAAPKANFVKIAINGESWGVYVNAQQFNKDFIAEAYPGAKGARWKVKGSPMGRGGLDYLGEDVEAYKPIYTLKTKDDGEAWRSLIALCRTLSRTPTEKLESALAPILDLDEALWFLAFDNALANGDGYWVRGSDYSLFRDDRGKFHVVPQDVNETFALRAGGPPNLRGRGPEAQGKPGRRGQGGIELDPLVGMDDTTKPLRSRLLAVPKLRAQYLRNVRVIAARYLDWKALAPQVRKYRALLDLEIAADTRKLDSTAAFEAAVSDSAPAKAQGNEASASLRAFAEGRRAYLLNHPALTALDRPTDTGKGR